MHPPYLQTVIQSSCCNTDHLGFTCLISVSPCADCWISFQHSVPLLYTWIASDWTCRSQHVASNWLYGLRSDCFVSLKRDRRLQHRSSQCVPCVFIAQHSSFYTLFCVTFEVVKRKRRKSHCLDRNCTAGTNPFTCFMCRGDNTEMINTCLHIWSRAQKP